jgi:hypothetical protein
VKAFVCVAVAALLFAGCGGGSGFVLADDPDMETTVRDALLAPEDLGPTWCCKVPNRVTQVDDVCGHAHFDSILLVEQGAGGEPVGGFAEIIQVYPRGGGSRCMKQLRDAIGDGAMDFPAQADETLAQRIDRDGVAIQTVYIRRDDAIISLLAGPRPGGDGNVTAVEFARLAVEKFDSVVGERTNSTE